MYPQQNARLWSNVRTFGEKCFASAVNLTRWLSSQRSEFDINDISYLVMLLVPSGHFYACSRLRNEISKWYFECVMLMQRLQRCHSHKLGLLSSLNTHWGRSDTSDSWLETIELRLTNVKILAKFDNIAEVWCHSLWDQEFLKGHWGRNIWWSDDS